MNICVRVDGGKSGIWERQLRAQMALNCQFCVSNCSVVTLVSNPSRTAPKCCCHSRTPSAPDRSSEDPLVSQASSVG